MQNTNLGPLGADATESLEWRNHQRDASEELHDAELHILEPVLSDDEEEFVYPSEPSSVGVASAPAPTRVSEPSPAQLESLFAAASSGDLPLLKRLFKKAVENGEVEAFALANYASTRTGFTALHAAASRGYYDIAVWRMFSSLLYMQRLTIVCSDRGMWGYA
ncbi:hypothetical protein CPB83DRAFT_320860 [Crepidotus variabilis]|uniref:Uncharacterized protein n=1 Tax=Crepidotus variabilis TaxID=179855 RepID=A0A9P6ESR2_9AGAR|nr:hypothetical protein CPB83DRAFT_320860 [Crepidotus variabilis]